ncbi:MAG: site-specific integrase [Acidobacteriaceae bacterium]|nr:site-specific integrase [Acidobacteriaceae bacterium]
MQLITEIVFVVTLMIRAKIGGHWGRFPVTPGKNGRVIPGLVRRKGEPDIRFKPGEVSYEVRHYVNGQAKYIPAGKNLKEAVERRNALEAQLTAIAIAKSAGVTVAGPSDRISLQQSFRNFIKQKTVEILPKSVSKLEYAIGLFLKTCSKTYLDEITTSDLVDFLIELKEKVVSSAINSDQPQMLADRSVFSYYVLVHQWLTAVGVDQEIFPKNPSYVEPEITIYSPEQIADFLPLVTGDLRILILQMLKCGKRESEAVCSYFSDINWREGTFLISAKPELGFSPKNKKERRVPIPDDLLAELDDWRNKHPRQRLICQGEDGKPLTGVIHSLKQFAFEHSLTCGCCEHCLAGHHDCEEWTLHKFRRTYITAICRYLDLPTAQKLAGHADIRTTQRYLAAAKASEVQGRVSQIDFTKPFYK